MRGRGPPPWHTEMAGARGMVWYDDVWLLGQTRELGRRKRLDSNAIEERFTICMSILNKGKENGQLAVQCLYSKSWGLPFVLVISTGISSHDFKRFRSHCQTLTNRGPRIKIREPAWEPMTADGRFSLRLPFVAQLSSSDPLIALRISSNRFQSHRQTCSLYIPE